MGILKWHAGLSVGNRELDQQHRELLGLCEAAATLLAADACVSEDFHRVLNDIMELLIRHFVTEECILAANGCPELAAHMLEHRASMERLTDLLCKGFRTRIDTPALLSGIGEWLNEHIAVSDISIKGYLAAGLESALAAPDACSPLEAAV